MAQTFEVELIAFAINRHIVVSTKWNKYGVSLFTLKRNRIARPAIKVGLDFVKRNIFRIIGNIVFFAISNIFAMSY